MVNYFKSPEVAALERENETLRRELNKYKSLEEDFCGYGLDYQAKDPSPCQQTMRQISLPLAGEATLSPDEGSNGMQVLLKGHCEDGTLQYKYYFQHVELLTAVDAANVMAELHRKVIEALTADVERYRNNQIPTIPLLF